MDFAPAHGKGFACITDLREGGLVNHVLVFSKIDEVLLAERVLQAGT